MEQTVQASMMQHPAFHSPPVGPGVQRDQGPPVMFRAKPELPPLLPPSPGLWQGLWPGRSSQQSHLPLSWALTTGFWRTRGPFRAQGWADSAFRCMISLCGNLVGLPEGLVKPLMTQCGGHKSQVPRSPRPGQQTPCFMDKHGNPERGADMWD